MWLRQEYKFTNVRRLEKIYSTPENTQALIADSEFLIKDYMSYLR